MPSSSSSGCSTTWKPSSRTSRCASIKYVVVTNGNCYFISSCMGSPNLSCWWSFICIQEPKELKEQVKQLYHKYCGDQTLRAEEDADLEREVGTTAAYRGVFCSSVFGF